MIANYLPLQDLFGGPNYFNLDPNGVYKIHVDNDGDADSDLTFEFKFKTIEKNFTVNANGVTTATPLIQTGRIDATGANLNVQQTYTLSLVRHGAREAVYNATLGGDVFLKLPPTISTAPKPYPTMRVMSGNFIYDVSILPGCNAAGRVFVRAAQRDGFVVNLGEVFDLVNLNPVGPRDGEPNSISNKNVTSLVLEVPISCLTNGKDPVIGGWTTSSLREGDDWKQVSRLGMPLVNELIIGLPDKDKFNASQPLNDGQFLHYVTNPFLPVLLNTEFGNAAVIPASPRNDLIAAFLTGVKGLNQPLKITPSEMLRLNTSIEPTTPAAQNDLGVLGGDFGPIFPNVAVAHTTMWWTSLCVLRKAHCAGRSAIAAHRPATPITVCHTPTARVPAGPDAAHETVTGEIKAADT